MARLTLGLALSAIIASSCSAFSVGASPDQARPTHTAESGVSATTHASTPIENQVATTLAPTTTARPAKQVDREEVFAQLDELIDSQGVLGAPVQCDGEQASLGDALPIATAGGAERARVNERGEAMFTVGSDDKPYAGGRRCELALLPEPLRLRRHEGVVWQATRLKVDQPSPVEDQFIVVQWHDGDKDGQSRQPILAMYLRDKTLRVLTRSAISATPTTTEVETLEVGRFDDFDPGKWHDVVIKARVTPTIEDTPLLRVWIDGDLIVDSDLPFGYGAHSERDYVKVGIYHFSGENPWDQNVPTRTVTVSSLMLVDDVRSRYIFSDIELLLNESLGA